MVRQGSPQVEGACVFCDKKNFGERLIAETPSLYYVATLGQITGGYTLVIPKRHVSCLGAMTEEEVAEVKHAVEVAGDAIDMEYGMEPVVFEHGIVGQTVQHAHLHLVPANVRIEDRIHADFPGAKIDFISSLEVLRRCYAAEGKKYLLWSMPGIPKCYFPDGLFQATWDPPAPPQYLRIVAAELTGKPERANWRNMDPELDKKLWSETVTRLAPHLRQYARYRH
ncbi:MAG: HIT domain-containing protein [Candidatus Liptonbacteria bacterium]|nr:HIT domain-containing protein [Candidatus Liptonbacteria bacterium]